MRLAIGQLLLVNLMLLAAGCLPSQQDPAAADFRANDTPSRVPAIVGAADSDAPEELAELVRALADKDPAVRLFAIQSLRQRTGQTLGYRYYEPSDKRQAAVDRWHAWLADTLAPSPITQETTD